MHQSISIELDEKTGMMVISCPFHMNMMVKAMPVRRWNKSRKVWMAPLVWRNIEFIHDNFGFEPDDEAAEAMAAVMAKRMEKRPLCNFPVDYVPVLPHFGFQKEILDLSYGRPFAIFADMGTGKTKMTIDRMTALHMEGKIDRVLIICLKSARHVWPRELGIHSTIPYSCHLSKTKPQYNAWVNGRQEGLKWLVMGVETFSQGSFWEISIDYLRRSPTGFAIDEAHTISNSKTIRSKRLHDVSMACLYESRTVLTGTPITKGPENFFGIFKILDPDILGFPDIYSFEQRYVIKGGFENRQIVSYQNMQELFGLLQGSIYQITKKEALPHLPEKLYQERVVDMTKEQRSFYNQMKKNEFYETDEGSMTSTMILTKMLRLQQICNGYVASYPDGDISKKVILTPITGMNPKIQAILDIASEVSGKMIVWCVYRQELEDIITALDKEYGAGSCIKYHGLSTKYKEEERNKAQDIFQTDPSVRFFVSTVQSGSLGLTLTEATTTVYFANTFSIVDRKQSEDRNHRSGQTNAVLYIDIQMDKSIDALVTSALRQKHSIAEAVRQSLKEHTL